MKENAEDKLDENKDELDAYLFRYIDRFGENFPTCFVMGMGDEEMIGTIKKCLADNEPYKVNDPGDINY